MAFPISLDAATDETGLILCQEPWLRSRIMPLFRHHPAYPEDRVIGQGTTFRVDPWGGCLSAFHVIEDAVELVTPDPPTLLFRNDVKVSALELEGYAIGRTVSVPKKSWRPIGKIFAPVKIDQIMFDQPAKLVNAFELVALTIKHSTLRCGVMPFLKMDFMEWKPAEGEKVLAIGFAGLDVGEDGAPDDRPLSQHLYGSFGTITHVNTPDIGAVREWQFFHVDAYWPGGMSGGPVFNEAGHVIGLVSGGLKDDETNRGSNAVFFSSWSVPQTMMPTLEPAHPGRFRAYAVLNENMEVVAHSPNRALLARFARRKKLSTPVLASLEIDTAT